MTRAYLRLDPGFFERKILDQKYPLAAGVALIGALCLAESQPQRGWFRNRAVLRALLGPVAGRWVGYLVEHGDLTERPDLPQLYVEGWHEWQEGDVTVPQRMQTIRARRGDVGPVPGAVRTANWRLRRRVLERDSYACRYCGNGAYTKDWLVAEHVEPGGPTTEDNLVTACRPCNKVKGDRSPDEAGMPLLESGTVLDPPLQYVVAAGGRDVPAVTRGDVVTSRERDAVTTRTPSDGPRKERRAGAEAVGGGGGDAQRASRPPSTTDQDDDQPGEAEAYQRLGRRPTARQRAMLRSIADQERTSRADVASGWAVVSAWISSASKAEDALATVRTAAARARRDRRMAAAETPTATPVGPVNPGMAAVAADLASGMSMGNGHATSVSRDTALEQLRAARGLVVEPAWSALLARYGLTEADLDEAKP